jgi:hypothetical protein
MDFQSVMPEPDLTARGAAGHGRIADLMGKRRRSRQIGTHPLTGSFLPMPRSKHVSRMPKIALVKPEVPPAIHPAGIHQKPPDEETARTDRSGHPLQRRHEEKSDNSPVSIEPGRASPAGT